MRLRTKPRSWLPARRGYGAGLRRSRRLAYLFCFCHEGPGSPHGRRGASQTSWCVQLRSIWVIIDFEKRRFRRTRWSRRTGRNRCAMDLNPPCLREKPSSCSARLGRQVRQAFEPSPWDRNGEAVSVRQIRFRRADRRAGRSQANERKAKWRARRTRRSERAKRVAGPGGTEGPAGKPRARCAEGPFAAGGANERSERAKRVASPEGRRASLRGVPLAAGGANGPKLTPGRRGKPAPPGCECDAFDPQRRNSISR